MKKADDTEFEVGDEITFTSPNGWEVSGSISRKLLRGTAIQYYVQFPRRLSRLSPRKGVSWSAESDDSVVP